MSYHEHNERRRARELVDRVRAGEVVALVSDAGMPGVSDPGAVVVAACLEAGLPVEVLPGPSAAVTALVASGLPGERWRFTGFLPRRAAELRRELEADAGETLVAYESPRRIGTTLRALAELDPERPAAVCRELTKLHEEVVRGSAAELAERFADGARGEIVLVVGPAAEPDGTSTSKRPARRSSAWSRPARGAGRPHRSSRRSRAFPRTRFTGGSFRAMPPAHRGGHI